MTCHKGPTAKCKIFQFVVLDALKSFNFAHNNSNLFSGQPKKGTGCFLLCLLFAFTLSSLLPVHLVLAALVFRMRFKICLQRTLPILLRTDLGRVMKQKLILICICGKRWGRCLVDFLGPFFLLFVSTCQSLWVSALLIGHSLFTICLTYFSSPALF